MEIHLIVHVLVICFLHRVIRTSNLRKPAALPVDSHVDPVPLARFPILKMVLVVGPVPSLNFLIVPEDQFKPWFLHVMEQVSQSPVMEFYGRTVESEPVPEPIRECASL